MIAINHSHLSIHHQDFDKYRYVIDQPWKMKSFYALGIVCWLGTVYGYGQLWNVSGWMGAVYTLPVIIYSLYYCISYGINFFYIKPDVPKHIYETKKFCALDEAHKPTVDIFLPCCGEPHDVLERTYQHVAALDYPHVVAYILDEKNDPTIQGLARKYKLEYRSRPNAGEMKKAGNILYGFNQSQGEYIVIFDADFAPLPEFLNETIPYMIQDHKIGILQTPQHFEVHKRIHTESHLQYGAGAVQEDFYRIIQPARNTLGGAICVGTNAVYRRSALEKIGGTAQIEHSEDVWTGVLLINQGYTVEYLPYILAEGYCPDDVIAYFNQQYRRCKGSMSLMLSPTFWMLPVGWKTKLCYVSGFLYYITSFLSYFMTWNVFFLVMFHDVFPSWTNTLPFIPYIIYTFLLMPWSRLCDGVLSMYVTRFFGFASYSTALIHTICGFQMGRVATGDSQKVSTPPPLTNRKKETFSIYKTKILLLDVLFQYPLFYDIYRIVYVLCVYRQDSCFGSIIYHDYVLDGME